jgi:chemotaxis family two-component system sensor kinase Cph1
MSQSTLTPSVNLTNCDREPIHIPGSIQAHGFLLVFVPTPDGRLIVDQASENAQEWMQLPLQAILGHTCAELFGDSLCADLRKELRSREKAPPNHFLRRIRLNSGQEMEVITHTVEHRLVAEFEQAAGSISPEMLNTTLVNVVAQLETIRGIREVGDSITQEIQHLTGFDRVLLYSFDEEGHGTVLSEANNGRLPQMLHQHFPASDIPQQARRLYLLNRTRMIPAAEYTPSPVRALNPSDAPFDMTYCILRSVSPIHRDYMRNMGTAASMSFSVVIDGKLWGMISCHNAVPRAVPYTVRSACDVLTRIGAAQISANDRTTRYAAAVQLKAIERDLLTYMALEEKYLDGLTNHPDKVMALTNSTGAAFIIDNNCVLIGETPGESQVQNLARWLRDTRKPDVFWTDHLSSIYPQAESYSDTASGLMAVSLSQIHQFQILWFRPEIMRTVNWAGEPAEKTGIADGVLKINPRLSFASWSELVRRQSSPWLPVEVDAARDFRNAMLLIVLRRAEELADMAAELEFTNKELEAFSYSVSHDLRAPFRHISGFAELLLTDESAGLSEKGKRYIAKISQSAQFAGLLVDSLLNFSQIARTKLERRPVSMDAIVRDVWDEIVTDELDGRQVEFTCSALPVVEGDVHLLRQVWRNLLSNAVKYTKTRTVARIEVDTYQDHEYYVFRIRDNGVGFDNRYAHKLFGAFQRLHRMEEFEGTGIGLANVRRIIARHGGQTWAEGKLEEGAVFFFSLPVVENSPVL